MAEPPPSLTESSWSRAGRDLRRITSSLVFLLATVALDAVAAAVTGVLLLTATEASVSVVALIVVAVVSGTALSLASVYVIQVVRAPYRQRNDLREAFRDLVGFTDAIEVEPRPCAAYSRSDYVQHISVTNRGPKATFSAQVISNFTGLTSEYGRGKDLVWENPQWSEKSLGKDEEGHLRLASFERIIDGDDGGFEARFFAVPQHRHAGQPGYLPTMPYHLDGRELSFVLCIRNATKDIQYRWNAHVALDEDSGEPTLTLEAIP